MIFSNTEYRLQDVHLVPNDYFSNNASHDLKTKQKTKTRKQKQTNKKTLSEDPCELSISVVLKRFFGHWKFFWECVVLSFVH